MDLSDRVLGAHTANAIRKRNGSTVLQIGRDAFTRSMLSSVECFNFTAAATLSQVLTRELEVADTRDLFTRIAPTTLMLPRLGAVAFAVLGAAFEAKGIGGETPLANWYRRHMKGDEVTIASLKAREAREAAAERKTKKQRKHARRDEAHRLRVDRFTARQEASR